MRLVAAASLALLVGVAGFARAADAPISADDVIGARQAGFDLQQGVASAMKAAVESGGEVKPFADGAKGMSSWGHMIPALFPEGTQTGRNTKAKAAIWSDRAGFQKAAETFWQAADKLAAAAQSGDKGAFAAAFKETGAACGNCHRQFKER